MKQKLLLSAVISIASFFILGGAKAHAATITVATGNDTVAVDAVCHLSEAIENLNDQADTNADCVESGTYGTNDIINLPAGTVTLTASLPVLTHSITVQGQSKTTSIVDGDGLVINGFNLEVSSNGAYATYQDFSFQNVVSGGGPQYCVGAGDPNASVLDFDLIVRRMNFTNCNMPIIIDGGSFINFGVNTTAIVDNVNIIGPWASNPNQSYGLYGRVGELTMSNTTISGTGIAFNTSSTDNATISNVTFSGNAFAAIITINDTIDFINNTIVDNFVGIANNDGVSSLQNNILNNTCNDADVDVVFPGAGCVDIGVNNGETTNCTVLNTGSFVSGGNNLANDDCGGVLTTGNDDQINVATINDDLSPLANNGGSVTTRALLVGSPAINAGATVGSITADARGVARPQGASYDIGAFECDSNCTVSSGGGGGSPGGGTTDPDSGTSDSQSGDLANTGTDIRIIYAVGALLISVPIILVALYRRRQVSYKL